VLSDKCEPVSKIAGDAVFMPPIDATRPARPSVKQRIAGARLEPTFLMADVEVVATYELFNINRTKLENLLHRVFAAAQLDIEIKDRFGKPSVPREWFLVPLPVIDDVIEKLKNGSLTEFEYDPSTATLKKREK